jgi:hypothetical protein
MSARADIIVSSNDSTEVKLVVEARLRIGNLPETERQLRRFMLQLSCPLGLLVTPDHLWVYLDHFTSYSEESIERIGDFDVRDLITFAGTDASEAEFENAVQGWLENLSVAGTRDRVKDDKLLEVIRHYILPAVETGVVRATGPR